ncbi:MAG: hypothetical protein ACK2U0_20330 [Candidatus Promineifilaceae bacterium]|jgi:hypothetical protein
MPTAFSVHTSAVYKIRLQGVLEESWQDSIEDLQIISYRSSGEDMAPETILIGEVRDQAALSGILNLVYNLGLPLLDVQCLGRKVEAFDSE